MAPEFLSDILQDTVFVLKVKKLPTSPKHPQSDGLVERFNQTLKAMLLKLVTNKGCDLDRLKEPLLFAYQTMPHSLTKKTLLYGRDTKLPTALNFYSPHPKTPVIYSEYGKILFIEHKVICDITIINNIKNLKRK